LSAERSVARMRCNVDGVTGRPYRVSVAASVVNIAVMSRPVRSPSRMRPRWGSGAVPRGRCRSANVLGRMLVRVVKPVPKPSRQGPGLAGALGSRPFQQFVTRRLRGPACGVAASADPLPPTEDRRNRAVEVPTAMTTLGKPRTSAPQPAPAIRLETAAPLHDHTLLVHALFPGSTFISESRVVAAAAARRAGRAAE
jgi:hypothetical protein